RRHTGARVPGLMIPGRIEVAPAGVDAASGPPPGHLAPSVIESFGASLEMMRRVWLAPADAQPFIVAGSGTLAMEMAATNLLDPGEGALVVSSGYFSERMAEMLRRRGAKVTVVSAEPGDAPSLDAVEEALSSGAHRALFATPVDTSTGVRVDARALAQMARSEARRVGRGRAH